MVQIEVNNLGRNIISAIYFVLNNVICISTQQKHYGYVQTGNASGVLAAVFQNCVRFQNITNSNKVMEWNILKYFNVLFL